MLCKPRNTALILFYSQNAAKEYTNYVSRHEFFRSQRARSDYIAGNGETHIGLNLSGNGPKEKAEKSVKRMWVLKTHTPEIRVQRMTDEMLRELNFTKPTSVNHRKKDDSMTMDRTGRRATRSLRIDASSVKVEQMLHLCSPGDDNEQWAVDHIGWFPDHTGSEVTLICPFDCEKAKRLMHFIELLDKPVNAVYAKGICDKPCDFLGWAHLDRRVDQRGDR